MTHSESFGMECISLVHLYINYKIFQEFSFVCVVENLIYASKLKSILELVRGYLPDC